MVNQRIFFIQLLCLNVHRLSISHRHYFLIQKLLDIYQISFYEQAFYIIKSIVEATHDLNIDITNDYPELGMYLRISYRKADIEVKKIIEKYVMKLVFNQYYDNCYLEDMISNMN